MSFKKTNPLICNPLDWWKEEKPCLTRLTENISRTHWPSYQLEILTRIQQCTENTIISANTLTHILHNFFNVALPTQTHQINIWWVTLIFIFKLIIVIFCSLEELCYDRPLPSQHPTMYMSFAISCQKLNSKIRMREISHWMNRNSTALLIYTRDRAIEWNKTKRIKNKLFNFNPN